METFLPPEGITSLIWKGDTVLLIVGTSSSGEDCIRFFIGTEKEIFECMEYLFLACLFVITSLYSFVVYNGGIPCVQYKTHYFIAWNL
jgi:hypothetical protein